MSYEVLESQCMYKGKVLSIERDKITVPNGSTTVRETVVRGNAVGIVPIDENGDIIFVRQYRHAAKDMVLEIPAGMIENGEDPVESAKRELEEETGYVCEKPLFVNDVYMSVGVCTEKLYFYIAENLTEGMPNPDPDEFLEIERHSLNDAVEMIFSGKINDVKTMAGILAYNEYRNRNNCEK